MLEWPVRRELLCNLLNGALFQAVWMACAGGGAAGLWWPGPLAAFAFACWQIPRSAFPRGELRLVAVAVVAGLVIDTAHLQLGLLRFPAPGPLAPVWMVSLWAAFALTLGHSLAWLQGRPLLAALLGAVSGPLSYWAGARVWGAVELVAPTALVLAVLAVEWLLLTPALLALARRLARDGAEVSAGEGS